MMMEPHNNHHRSTSTTNIDLLVNATHNARGSSSQMNSQSQIFKVETEGPLPLRGGGVVVSGMVPHPC